MRSGRSRDERGSLTVELVVLTPVVLVVAMATLACGRISEGRQQVVEAARAGAEAAAILPTAGTAQWVGAMNAVVNLLGRSHTCAQVMVSVDTGKFTAGGSVTVHVLCEALLSDLAIPGLPGATTVGASATAPIDRYRSAG